MKDYSQIDLFLSDIHLGSPLIKKKDILRIILEGNYRSITLLGDIIDVWENDLTDIIAAEQSIITKISNINNLKIIIGNHDPTKQALQKVFPKAIILDRSSFNLNNGESVICLHGHEFDYMLQKYSLLVKILFIFYWISERLFRKDIRFLFKKWLSVSNKSNKGYYKLLTREIRKEAIDHYNNYDYIVMGHTHDPGVHCENNTTYINCGDWVNNHSYVEYSEEAGFQLLSC